MTFPPRVKMTYRKGGRPQVATAPVMDAQNHEYLSLEEHESLLQEARAEAFEEAAELIHEVENPTVALIQKAKEARSEANPGAGKSETGE